MNQRLFLIFGALWLLLTGCSPRQDFYGKVVDQYGNPVEGVTVNCNLMFFRGFDADERIERHVVFTDKKGEFDCTGFRASKLGIKVEKNGYDMGQGAGFYEPPNAADKTSPAERAVLHMWKFRNVEPLFTAKIFSRLAIDGTPQNLDPSTGRKDAGNFSISYVRTPLYPEQGKAFDGVLTLKMTNGGFVEVKDLYPYDAPAAGYHASVDVALPASAHLGGGITRAYYIFDGKHYGRIVLDFSYGDIRNVYYDLRCFVNLSGSRNLEVLQGTHPFP
jgi:hypothetical protein